MSTYKHTFFLSQWYAADITHISEQYHCATIHQEELHLLDGIQNY